MKKKTNSALQALITMLLCSLLLSCEQEESLIRQETSQTKKLHIKIESWDHWKDHHSQVATKIEKLRNKKVDDRNLHSSEYDFMINEDQVQIIEKDNYTSYTFLISRDETQEGILENYMFKEFTDGTYKQFLLTYYYTLDSFGNKVFDTTDMGVELITDENLVLNRSTQSGDCHPHFVEVFDG